MRDEISFLTRRTFVRLCGGGLAATASASAGLRAAEDADQRISPADRLSERGAASSRWTENWEEGMVSGNGRMGAVVYGRPESPVFLVNHNRLYARRLSPEHEAPANTARFLPEIRRLIREQGYGSALDFAYEKAKENGLAPDDSVDFHPGFFLQGALTGAENATAYRRWENFRTGEVVTSWRGAAGEFQTKLFVSRADNVIVLSVAGPGPRRLSGSLRIAPIDNPLIQSSQAHGRDWFGVQNLYASGDGGYNGVVRVVSTGGDVQVADDGVSFREAAEILLLMRVERHRPLLMEKAEALAESLPRLKPEYDALLAPHVRIHGEIFDRVTLDLGGGSDRRLTTDELLERAAAEKKLSAALAEKIYDACRYVVLSSSGDLPPNLQGVWTGSWTPPWHGDYSADANLQLAVDSICSANMPELMSGFFDLVEAGVPSWREGAKKLAGCRGILYPARMQDQGTYFQQSRDWPWFNQIPIAGWLGHYFFDYFLYTGDRAFLEHRAIPYLKECALFYEDWYVAEPDGRLRATPSFSYECAYSDNAAIDFAVAREVLSNLIMGCELLGIEAEGVARWKALLGRIPPYMVNTAETTGGPTPAYKGMDGNGTLAAPDGSLKEFIEKNMVEYPSHRHLSPLYPLFVSYEFDPEATPELWKAAAVAYEKKIASVRETESHYRMQAGLCAARLGRGNDVWGFLTAMAANGVFHSSLVPSHYDHHRVFNVDASGGIPSVIQNSLVFSLPGRLDLLPALPDAMPAGSIRGILARSGLTLHRLEWAAPEGRITVELTSPREQKVRVGLPAGFRADHLQLNGRRQELQLSPGGQHFSMVSLRGGRSLLEIRRASA